jgi:hypothetical protein
MGATEDNMQTSKSIPSWLTLGPIYNPAHQTHRHSHGDGHPLAADIIMDIDNDCLAPQVLT